MEKIIKKFVASDIDVKLARLFVVIMLSAFNSLAAFCTSGAEQSAETTAMPSTLQAMT